MNFLPLVFSFLFILSLVISSFHHTLIATKIEKATLSGYFRAVRLSRIALETKAYDKVPKKPRVKEAAKESPSEEEATPTTKGVERKWTCEGETAKFNLSRLLDRPDDPTSKVIYDTAARLIRNLYRKAPFYKDGIEYPILDALLKEKTNAFTTLFPEDGVLSEIFYKMLQGTSSYNAATQEGYPPFLAYFTLAEWTEERRPINFPSASLPLLIAALGTDLTLSLIKQEREKEYFKKPEFQELVKYHSSKEFHFSHIDTLFGFGNKANKKTKAFFIDESSHITLRKWSGPSVAFEEEES